MTLEIKIIMDQEFNPDSYVICDNTKRVNKKGQRICTAVSNNIQILCYN